MYLFDASSIILAWDNYPIENFPPFWVWFSKQIEEKEFMTSEVAYDEVSKKSPDCTKWLNQASLGRLEVSNNILQFAAHIQHLLGIENDAYHPKGVDENDVLVVAAAKVHKSILVSDESRQTKLPLEMKKYKIPAVCSLAGIDVECVSLVELIKKSGERFV